MVAGRTLWNVCALGPLFWIGWYLSQDTDYDLGDPLIGVHNVSGGLAGGTSTSGTTPLTMISQSSLPSGWATSGPYYIVMFNLQVFKEIY